MAVGIPEGVRQPLSDALGAVAGVVRAWDGDGDPVAAADSADERIEKLVGVERGLPSDPSESAAVTSAVFTLRRMLVVLRERSNAASTARGS